MHKIVMTFIRLMTAVGLLFTFFTSASGQQPGPDAAAIVFAGPQGLGTEYQISTALNPDLDRNKPAVAYNSQRNEFLVVWHYHDASHYWIEGRTVNRRGEPMGVIGRILHASSVGVYQPSAAYNAVDNQYLIVWMQNSNGDGKTYEIWGNIFTADMSSVRTPFKIISWANRTFWTPRAAWNSKFNEFMVIWNAVDATTMMPTDIAHASLFANGEPRGTLIITAGQTPHDADLAYNPVKDEYLVVWRQQYGDTGDFDIWGARVSAETGNVVNPPGKFPISLAGEIEQSPRVATNAHDRYMVVWQIAAPGPCCDWDIHGREVNFDGNLIGNQNNIAGWGNTDETNPFVAAWPGNTRKYLVGYERTTAQDNWTETWASFYDNGMNSLDVNNITFWIDSFGVGAYAFWNATAPAGAADRSGALMVYQGDASGDPTVKQHIYGRIYTPYPVYLPALSK